MHELSGQFTDRGSLSIASKIHRPLLRKIVRRQVCSLSNSIQCDCVTKRFYFLFQVFDSSLFVNAVQVIRPKVFIRFLFFDHVVNRNEHYARKSYQRFLFTSTSSELTIFDPKVGALCARCCPCSLYEYYF